MKFKLDNAWVEIRPGVRLTTQADGVVLIEPSATVIEAPVKSAKPDTGRTNGSKPTANGTPIAWWKDGRFETATRVEKAPLTHHSAETETLENQILQAILNKPDPYAWVKFGDIITAAFPAMVRRKYGRATPEYNRVGEAMKRLRGSQELDYEERGSGRGRGRRAFYRLHKPHPGTHEQDRAGVETQNATLAH